MAGRLWKNSAGLVILYAENCRYAPGTERLTKFGPLVPTHKSTKEDFQILLVQRSVESRFMANTHVFPGGKMEHVDHSQDWKELFNSLVSNQSFDNVVEWLVPRGRDGDSKRLPIYKTIPRGGIPGEVALRICAIRETFEESGILFARNGKDALRMTKSSDHVRAVGPSVRHIPDLEQWRHRVHNNADDFLTMCREFKCVPDVWSLVEWSNWLTPESLPRRYDTVFYLCCINERPSATPENEEIIKTEWLSPEEALSAVMSKSLVLPGPQYAEVSFMSLFPNLPCLHSFALNRPSAVQPYRRLSLRVKAGEKILSILPRDDLYPSDYNPEDPHPAGQVHNCKGEQLKDRVTLIRANNLKYEYEVGEGPSYQVLEEMSQNKSRMVFQKFYPKEYFDNVEAPVALDFIRDYCSELSQLTSKL